MADEKQTHSTQSTSDRWAEPANRLRSTARVFVTSLAAVAVAVLGGLSLTGLGQLPPDSTSFKFAVAGALMAATAVVALLAVSIHLATASSVSISELRTPSSHQYALKQAKSLVENKDNGLLAGYADLTALMSASANALINEQVKVKTYVKNPTEDNQEAMDTAIDHADWYRDRIMKLTQVASYQRLRWHFGTATWIMTGFGVIAAIGVVMYAAALQPRDAHGLVALTTHDKIQVHVPTNAAEKALLVEALGCDAAAVDGLVLSATAAEIEVITIPADTCRSVTLAAAWDGEQFVATFSAEEQPEK